MTTEISPRTQFTYNVHSDTDAEAFFALMARSGVQQSRIDAMRATRQSFLSQKGGEQ